MQIDTKVLVQCMILQQYFIIELICSLPVSTIRPDMAKLKMPLGGKVGKEAPDMELIENEELSLARTASSLPREESQNVQR